MLSEEDDKKIRSIYTARFSWSINVAYCENLHVVHKIKCIGRI